jgi:tetratricopeptide (TPR) repeat protein
MLNSAAMKRVMTKEEMLQEAVEAGQSGELARARSLLLDLLRQDNREPLYWLLMSTAVESREERIYCLQNVLFLDPDNSAAKHDLELLGADVPMENSAALLPEEQEDWQTAEIAAPKIPKKRKKQKEEPWSISLIFGSLGIGLVVILLGYYAAANGFLDVVLGPTGTPTITGRAGIGQPSSTPAPDGDPTREIVIVPRDPNDLLSATYTPTPRYINTPHADDASFQQGMIALDDEDWALATTAFQQYLASNPQAVDAAYYLGEAQLGAGDFEAALDAFERALALDPQFAPAYLGLARLGIAREANSTQIIADLNTALLLDQNLVDAYFERAAYNLARGNVDSAADDVSAAEGRAPQSAVVQYYKALVALAQENYGAALTASQRAFDLDVTLLPNYLALAEAQQGLNQQDAAIETMQTYLNFEATDGRGWELLGLGYQLTGDADLGLEAFNRALELDPNLPRAAYYRGLAEQAGGNHQAALNFFRIAVAGVPTWFEAHIALAQEYLADSNPSAAFFEVNTSGNLVETDAQRAAFFYWRALSLEALGQTVNALADWRSLLALPSSAMPAEWRAEAEERVQS